MWLCLLLMISDITKLHYVRYIGAIVRIDYSCKPKSQLIYVILYITHKPND